MSVLVMAGSSQLMVVGMIGQASVFTMIMATFFINLRHLVMSSSVMSRLKAASLPSKLLCAFALCDESFALFSFSGSTDAAYLLGSNAVLYGTWVFSSLVGCLLGQVLPETITKGFGIAIYAAFLSMLVLHAAKHRDILLLIILTAAINCVLQIWIPSSWAIILSMTVSAILGTWFVDLQENEDK